MELSQEQVEKVKSAVKKVGDFGTVTLVISDGIIDLLTEGRERIQSKKKLPDNAFKTAG